MLLFIFNDIIAIVLFLINNMTKLSTINNNNNNKISKAELAMFEMSVSYYVGKKVSKKVGRFFCKDFTSKLTKMYGK